MIAMNGQARRVLSAGLLLFTVAGCGRAAAAPTATALPTLGAEASATATAAQNIPVAPARGDVETYEVQDGDMVSSIAAQFSLQPETVLWANYGLLLDDPDFLFPGMELLILPVDGVYHQVGGTDTLISIANFFGADVQAIKSWPGNAIDPNSDLIFPGQWLVVPGGRRALRRRMMPNLPRFAMAVDFEEYGSGACPQNVTSGADGDGIYAWPVSDHRLVGDGYWSAHMAADLAATIGEEVHASDDGVVVFSGWSNLGNLGYGNMVMLDHGNGDFSLYAGLAETTALCGHSVSEGDVIGVAGITGHPVGPYLHFEIRRGDDFLDPIQVLPPNN
jgi:LysM repeat protein